MTAALPPLGSRGAGGRGEEGQPSRRTWRKVKGARGAEENGGWMKRKMVEG